MGKSNDNWKERLGVVFSTDPDYDYSHDDADEEDTLPAGQQVLRVLLDKKQRKGKGVTLVTGFVGTTEDLKSLGKQLKTQCGVGGSVKDGDILIQGDHRPKVVNLLRKAGYTQTKQSGG